MTFLDRAGSPRNSFDFLRFVFATAVVFSHSFALLTGTEKHEPIARLTHGALTFGALALAGFFALSGYLVTHSWLRSRGVIDYLRKRVLRIYPGFIGVILVGALVIGPLAALDVRAYLAKLPFGKLIGQALILHEPSQPGVFHDIPFPQVFNGSLWTIKWEFCCYLLVPILAAFGLFRRRIGTTLVFLAFLVAFAAFAYGNILSVPRSVVVFGGPAYGWLRCGAYFLGGMTFYLWRDKIPARFSWCVAALIALLVFQRWIDLALMIFGPYLLFYGGYARNAFLSQWSRPGDFSYGLYLYAWPVQQLTVQWFGRSLTVATFFLLAFFEIALFAVFSWFVIERPFLRLKYGRNALAHPSGPVLTN